MKKKRLLSLLLAAVLVSSSVPMTAITADTASGDTALDMDKWGNVTVTSPEKASDARPGYTDGSYIRLVGGLSTGQTYTQTANIKKELRTPYLSGYALLPDSTRPYPARPVILTAR